VIEVLWKRGYVKPTRALVWWVVRDGYKIAGKNVKFSDLMIVNHLMTVGKGI
jgi:hypothetical protein